MFLQRSVKSKCRSFPPSSTTCVNTRLVEYWYCSVPTVCKTKFSGFASVLPHCKTISVHFLRVNLNSCRQSYRVSAFNALHHLQASNILWHATFDIPTGWCGVTLILSNCESNNPTSPLLTMLLGERLGLRLLLPLVLLLLLELVLLWPCDVITFFLIRTVQELVF